MFLFRFVVLTLILLFPLKALPKSDIDNNKDELELEKQADESDQRLQKQFDKYLKKKSKRNRNRTFKKTGFDRYLKRLTLKSKKVAFVEIIDSSIEEKNIKGIPSHLQKITAKVIEKVRHVKKGAVLKIEKSLIGHDTPILEGEKYLLFLKKKKGKLLITKKIKYIQDQFKMGSRVICLNDKDKLILKELSPLGVNEASEQPTNGLPQVNNFKELEPITIDNLVKTLRKKRKGNEL